MTFLPGNQLGKLNKGHPDYLSAEQRKANGPKISAAKKGKPLTAVQRASLQRYWASKKGTSTHAPYGRVIACLTCGTLRYKYPRDLRRSPNQFCSRQCGYQHKDRGATSARQKAMKTGIYKKWRKHVFQRDNNTCQACGIQGGRLVADHEMSYANYPALRYEILNGRTLCTPCHEKTPNYGARAYQNTDL